MQNSRLSNHGGGVLSHGGAPICNCGQVVVLRTARTTKNGGKQFWVVLITRLDPSPFFFVIRSSISVCN